MKARREEGMRRLHSLFALKHSACVECVCVRVLVFVPEWIFYYFWIFLTSLYIWPTRRGNAEVSHAHYGREGPHTVPPEEPPPGSIHSPSSTGLNGSSALYTKPSQTLPNTSQIGSRNNILKTYWTWWWNFFSNNSPKIISAMVAC